MRIGIDVSCWMDSRGFGRFTRELVRAFVAVHGRDHEILLVCDGDTADRGGLPAGADLRVVHRTGATSPDGWRGPFDLLAFRREAGRCHADVFFFPSVSTFYPVPGRIPVVVTIHDVMTEEHPERFFRHPSSRMLWRAKMWLARRRARMVVTPSHDARRRVAATLRLPLGAVACIGEAPAACFGPGRDAGAEAAVRRRWGIPDEAQPILYVGGLDPHKNLPSLFQALVRIGHDHAVPWHLVLVGHSPGPAQELRRGLERLAAESGIADRITWTGWVSDAELALLYRSATLLVLPSLDEGFGLPVVEAMASGLPVAVSARGSLPEVVGDAGLLFDPEDPGDIADAVTRLLNDEALRTELRRRGLARVSGLSWEAAARQLMTVFEAEVAHS